MRIGTHPGVSMDGAVWMVHTPGSQWTGLCGWYTPGVSMDGAVWGGGGGGGGGGIVLL